MTLLALLVSTDDSASEILGRVLAASGIAVERFSNVEAATDRLRQQRFDAIVVDFEDPEAAGTVLAESRILNSGTATITVALVADPGRVRDILSGGAHFVLYKPLSDDKARAGLRALAALLNRERRRAQRVTVQAPVDLVLSNDSKAEGILLDLSETGMEILTAEPQAPGAQLSFRFHLPDGTLDLNARGRVAWANRNGQTGVHFLELDEPTKARLQAWVNAAAGGNAGAEEPIPSSKLTDLSLGGCYLETESPFPEHALVDICLKTEEIAVHTEGMVRVTHPGQGMGVEFPCRTAEQRTRVGNLISFLRSYPESVLGLIVTPRALTADASQFERALEPESNEVAEDLEDPLLELLRQGSTLQQNDFLEELRRQRSGESVAT